MAAGCLWILNPAIGLLVLVCMAFLAPAGKRGYRLAAYAIASLYAGLLAYTQSSTGMVPRDAERYYSFFSALSAAPSINLRGELLKGMVPFFNAIQLLLSRTLRLPPQSLSLVSVAGTMCFFSLGFSRLARRSGASAADELILWALSFTLAFNLSQTGELLKQYLANSLFFYAYALLADGSPLFLLPLLASLGSHNSAFMFLPLLLFSRWRPKPIIYAFLLAAALVVGSIGPYSLTVAVTSHLKPFDFLAAKAKIYDTLSWADTPKRDYIIFLFYLACDLLLMSGKRGEKRRALPSLASLEGLCVGYCILCLAGIRSSVLAERLIGGGSAVYGAFLLWSAMQMDSVRGRLALWLQVSFLLVSTALLYNASLGSFGHYSFDLMGGDWRRLLGASVPDLLRFKAAW
jgi:hypothetical protein